MGDNGFDIEAVGASRQEIRMKPNLDGARCGERVDQRALVVANIVGRTPCSAAKSGQLSNTEIRSPIDIAGQRKNRRKNNIVHSVLHGQSNTIRRGE